MSYLTSNQIAPEGSQLCFPVLKYVAISLLLYVYTPGNAADVSPHWNSSACSSCHTSTSPTDDSDLRDPDHNTLCADCHGETSESACPHPTNLPVQDSDSLTLPDVYRPALVDERIVCTTCHALEVQCTGGRREQYENPSFLRSVSFRPGKMCLDCHDAAAYKKLNPHDLDSADQADACQFCHEDTPGPDNSIHSRFRLGRGEQCMGCHAVIPHPLSVLGTPTDTWTHLVVPAPGMLMRMKSAEDRTGIMLPLDIDDGSITCATCHNVHATDLPDYALRTDSGTANKLRMLNICEACHDK